MKTNFICYNGRIGNIILILVLVAGSCSSGASISVIAYDYFDAPYDGPLTVATDLSGDNPVRARKDVFIPLSGEQYAFREYNVTPFDTIWFDEYFIVGRDTTAYDQIYQDDGEFAFSSDFYCTGPFFNFFIPIYPFISIEQLIEDYKQLAEESKIYNYQYYMPKPPVITEATSKPDDPYRNHRGFIRVSMLSAALAVLSVLP